MDTNSDDKSASTPDTKSNPTESVAASAPNAIPDTVDATYFVNGSGGKPQRKKLPQWLDHFNARDLKVLFKASLAVWIMTILIFINDTINLLGQATFFGR